MVVAKGNDVLPALGPWGALRAYSNHTMYQIWGDTEGAFEISGMSPSGHLFLRTGLAGPPPYLMGSILVT